MGRKQLSHEPVASGPLQSPINSCAQQSTWHTPGTPYSLDTWPESVSLLAVAGDGHRVLQGPLTLIPSTQSLGVAGHRPGGGWALPVPSNAYPLCSSCPASVTASSRTCRAVRAPLQGETQELRSLAWACPPISTSDGLRTWVWGLPVSPWPLLCSFQDRPPGCCTPALHTLKIQRQQLSPCLLGPSRHL